MADLQESIKWINPEEDNHHPSMITANNLEFIGI